MTMPLTTTSETASLCFLTDHLKSHLENSTATCQHDCVQDAVHKSYVTISKIDRAFGRPYSQKAHTVLKNYSTMQNTKVELVSTCSSTHYSYNFFTRKQRHFALGSLHSEQKDGPNYQPVYDIWLYTE